MSRLELAAKAAELRSEGLKLSEIAERVGLSRRYVHDLLYDPDGSLARARKESYGGTCESCGGPTSGSEGPSKVARFCLHCAPSQTLRIWTQETVIAAIQEWARRHGRPPTSTEWVTRTVADDGYVFPPRTAVYDSHNGNGRRPFDSWADAIEAAGFPRPKIGHKTKGRTMQTNGAAAKPTLTRAYLVFAQDDDGRLRLVGETEASTNQQAIEALAAEPGSYSSVAKGSLQTFTLQTRLVASRV